VIRHIVLFKLRPGISFEDPAVLAAEQTAHRVGDEVPALKEWQAGRNITGREEAYDFAVVGLVADERALADYMQHPFHQEAIRQWRAISTWVIADLVE
jgi:Stress responsive A/B Barrel Domain